MYINLRLAASIIIIKMKIVLRASSPRPAGGFFDIDMPSISVIQYASREEGRRHSLFTMTFFCLWESFLRLSLRGRFGDDVDGFLGNSYCEVSFQMSQKVFAIIKVSTLYQLLFLFCLVVVKFNKAWHRREGFVHQLGWIKICFGWMNSNKKKRFSKAGIFSDTWSRRMSL